MTGTNDVFLSIRLSTLSTRLSRRTMLRPAGVLVVTGSTLLLAGCTFGKDDANPAVKMIEMTFQPAALTIKLGQTVTWTNRSSFVHTVTTDPGKVKDPTRVSGPAGAAVFDSGNIAPEERWSQTFTVAGTYAYCCAPHELTGMVGTIVVTRDS